ncbi:Phage LexA repressor [Candidatus Arthromitus sp. SFB-mouse-NL]|uniref:helix-turn-helix domain-containing protein n=1 Tax=Candidatus Arthromitus sp. SFB-mouse-NL TaxID=1508644 RepID=UPI00049B5973|nr:helix-turn-helix transcriptional regulator [Candidatus Arthromitus sp. SFB-mouse-NL]AID45448.1 Phage LexA repressor [Candidatus Arthromitus sp. SFB-mouse-NL]
MNRSKYLKDIGKRIKKIRRLGGLSQYELAKMCGYKSRSTINKIETGINDVPIYKLKIITEMLNIDVTIILNENEFNNFYENNRSNPNL